jgi:aminopeptidase N
MMMTSTRCALTLAACALLGWPMLGCAPNTDVTVAPPRVEKTFAVEAPAAQPDGRLPAWARPLRYRVRLEVDPDSSRFSGDVVIDIELDKPSGAIVLHATDLTIERAEVIAAGGITVPVETHSRAAAGARDETDELVVLASSELSGEVQLHLTYSGPLETTLRGIYRAEDGGENYVFTQLEPSDARRVFPSFDDPIHKVPFDAQIVVPDGDIAVFNTPEISRKSENGRTLFQFATTERLPTYLFAFAVGPLDVVEGPVRPVPIRLIAAKGKGGGGQLALKQAAVMLERLDAWFGRPYPYAKLDLVAVPNFGPGAMENAGLVTFREELLLVDEKTSSAKSRRDMNLTLAHELAHQWFGNLVTMKWWDDLWLNEGFASYMETVIVDELYPGTNAELELLSWTGRVMQLDALDAARQVRQPVANTYQAEEAFDGITYIKGGAVIRMIHRWIGDKPFQDGVRAYINRHAWSNAAASDMFEALAASSQQDVAAVASSFLDQPGLPLVTAELRCDGETPVLALTQRRYRGRLTTAADQEGDGWRIPVCVSYPTGRRRAARIARSCGLLTGPELTLALAEADGCPAWVLPNAGHAGYYRYGLDAERLAALASAVPKLDVGTRLGFSSNLWALVQAGEAEGTQVIDHLLRMKGQAEREVIDAMIGQLAHVSDALVEPRARPTFSKLASTILLPTAKRLGWDARAGDSEDDRLLRRAVLAALAIHTNDPWLVEGATKRAKAWLENPTSVDADSAVIAMRVAARRGVVDFARLRKALSATADDARHRVVVVQAMGSLGKPEELVKALNLLEDGTIVAQDGLYLTRTAVDWPDSRLVVVQWLGEHMAALGPKMPGFGVARLIAPVRRLCEPTARDRAEAQLRPAIRKIGASERRLDEALQAADLCIDLRRRQASSVSVYLQQKRRF